MQKKRINTPSHLVSATRGQTAGHVAPNPSMAAATSASRSAVAQATSPTAAAETAALTQAAGLTAGCLTDRGPAWSRVKRRNLQTLPNQGQKEERGGW